MKQQPGGGGSYVPITACQNFTPGDSQFENGIFLGPLAHLTFKGPFTWQGVRTACAGGGTPLNARLQPSLGKACWRPTSKGPTAQGKCAA